MAAIALISSPIMAYNYTRKGTSLLLALNFNRSVGYIASFHTQIPGNPFAFDSIAKLGPTQIRKLVFQKHKLGFDKLSDAFSLFHRMVEIRSRLSVVNFNHLLSVVAKMKQHSTVISLFGEIHELGIPINECTQAILIDCCCRMNRVDLGFAILGFFLKCGYKVDVATFTTLINGHMLQGNTVDAMKLFLRLTKDKDIIPNEVTYGTIINGLCKLGNTTMATQFVRSMHKWNFKPTVVIYSAIIDNLCKDGKVDDAFSLLSEMRECDVMPNVVTYTSLVKGFCKKSRGMDATRMLSDMGEKNIFPDVITYSMLVDAFCKEGKTKEAHATLAIMIRRGEEPNVVNYNALKHGYCLQENMDKAKEVLESMVDGALSDREQEQGVIHKNQMRDIHINSCTLDEKQNPHSDQYDTTKISKTLHNQEKEVRRQGVTLGLSLGQTPWSCPSPLATYLPAATNQSNAPAVPPQAVPSTTPVPSQGNPFGVWSAPKGRS